MNIVIFKTYSYCKDARIFLYILYKLIYNPLGPPGSVQEHSSVSGESTLVDSGALRLPPALPALSDDDATSRRPPGAPRGA